MTRCTIIEEGVRCQRPISRKKYQWCEAHYARWRRYGDPTERRGNFGNQYSGQRYFAVTYWHPCARCGRWFAPRRHIATGYIAVHCSRDCACGKGGAWQGSASPHWKAEPGYMAAHRRVYREKGHPTDYPCRHCGGRAFHWALDHEHCESLLRRDTDGRSYSAFPEDYIALCVPCHSRFDHQTPRYLEIANS